MSEQLESVAAFLNTLDERTFGDHGSASRDELATPAALARWLSAHGLIADGARVSRDDHTLVRSLRDGLRVLLASGDGAALNRLAGRLPSVVGFASAGPTLEPVAASAATRFATQLLADCAAAGARGDWPLLKICKAPDCRWVFVDHSRNHLGRWCATRVCGNRVKTRTYRARRRGVLAS